MNGSWHLSSLYGLLKLFFPVWTWPRWSMLINGEASVKWRNHHYSGTAATAAAARRDGPVVTSYPQGARLCRAGHVFRANRRLRGISRGHDCLLRINKQRRSDTICRPRHASSSWPVKCCDENKSTTPAIAYVCLIQSSELRKKYKVTFQLFSEKKSQRALLPCSVYSANLIILTK